jgi:hypothetical protein
MSEDASRTQLARRHIGVGLWALLLFVTLGAALETLHGFKADLYLNVENEARRLMWRLAHAHGTLIALVHVIFGLLTSAGHLRLASRLRIAAGALSAALLLIPGGFFLGGVVLVGGDPGPAVLLVPPGAVCLIAAVLLTALSVRPGPSDGPGTRQPSP